MGVKKKVGIGIGIVILSFIVLVIISQVYLASLTPEERQKLEDQRVARELQAKIDAEQEEKTQDLMEENRLLREKNSLLEGEMAEVLEEQKALQQQKAEAKISPEDLQKIIAGFEAYNKSVKMLLDMCVNVESENDFRQMMSLIAEQEEKFLDTTAGYGTVRNTLVSEGYDEHPVLGPLMSRSGMLVDQMSTCMELLAWEFGG